MSKKISMINKLRGWARRDGCLSPVIQEVKTRRRCLSFAILKHFNCTVKIQYLFFLSTSRKDRSYTDLPKQVGKGNFHSNHKHLVLGEPSVLSAALSLWNSWCCRLISQAIPAFSLSASQRVPFYNLRAVLNHKLGSFFIWFVDFFFLLHHFISSSRVEKVCAPWLLT